MVFPVASCPYHLQVYWVWGLQTTGPTWKEHMLSGVDVAETHQRSGLRTLTCQG